MADQNEPETKYQQLYSTMIDAFGAVDMNGQITEVNQPFIDLVGYEKAELLTMSIYGLTPPKWHELENRIVNEQVLVQGYSEVFQKEYCRKDGEIVPVELRVILARAPDGSPTGMWAMVRDISERIKKEEELRRFQHSVESSPEAVFWLNSEGRFPYVNEQACRWLGYTRDELMRLHLWDIDANFAREQWSSHWERVTKSGGARLESLHKRRDGSVFPVEISSKNVVMDGQVHHVAYVRDISDRKKAEEEQRFFKHAIDTCPEGVFWMGQSGSFIYVNDHACRSLGYSREELMKMHLWDIDPNFPSERWSDHWEEMRIIQSRLIETHHQRKDGTIFSTEVMAYRLPFGDEERHLAFVRDITERKQSAEALEKSEARYRLLFESNPQPMWLIDTENDGFIAVNPTAIDKYGYSESEFLSMEMSDITGVLEETRLSEKLEPSQISRNNACYQRHRLKNEDLIDVEIHAHELTFEGRQAQLMLINDITDKLEAEKERNKLEAQLIQAQKLESVGRLAGGVAHDFNNMLSVILGYSELMKGKLAPKDPLLRDLDQIQQAAERSQDITQQLLAFSRKQVLEPKILNINDLLKGFESNLSRLIGEDINFLFVPSPDIENIEFDPTHIEQIIMNLAVNARDAMPQGGKLTIETSNVSIDEAYCRDHLGFFPGNFVQIAVSDDGIGMAVETINQIFEPFFTTKEIGKGTGLGLATVYGIVKQGGGFINVYSEPGQGTTFKIYIPIATGEAEVTEKTVEILPELGSETVFLVEDDAMVRKTAEAILEKLGYKVISVADPEAAIAIFQKEHRSIDLLITDVVMPKMNGKILYNELKSIRPDLKVLYMSGYTDNVIVHHGVLDKGVQFVSKPFNINSLAIKVRETLDTK